MSFCAGKLVSIELQETSEGLMHVHVPQLVTNESNEFGLGLMRALGCLIFCCPDESPINPWGAPGLARDVCECVPTRNATKSVSYCPPTPILPGVLVSIIVLTVLTHRRLLARRCPLCVQASEHPGRSHESRPLRVVLLSLSWEPFVRLEGLNLCYWRRFAQFLVRCRLLSHWCGSNR